MPIAAGQSFTHSTDVPVESRPARPPQNLEDLRGGQGVRHTARFGEDGTRWCIGCDTTVSTKANFCTACARERGRISAARSRRRDPRYAQVKVETLYQVQAATREIEQAILAVILDRQDRDGHVSEEFVTDLMVASKALALVVRGGIDLMLPEEAEPSVRTPRRRPLLLN